MNLHSKTMNYLKALLLSIIATCIIGCSEKTSLADFNVIPKPVETSVTDGTAFKLNSSTTISYPTADSALARQAKMLAAYISDQSGVTIKTKADAAGSNTIRLRNNLITDNREAYKISVSSDSIVINGASDAGTFYGIQTLRKAIQIEKVNSISIPDTEISDSPRFAYRGMHLDVVRHFFPIDSVKEYIDMLALHNMNKLHWHLTDDQGWRIEIKSRPRLTEIGSKRPATEGTASYMLFDSIPQNGFYTQDELRDIVRYAADRYIDIIPEVDLPGHMQAALASYPELGCTGGPYKVTDCWTAGDNVLCLGKEETYRFLDDVFSELTNIFPYETIHIGGDECNRNIWKNCKACQTEADRIGLKDDSHGTREAKLQNHAMHHVAAFLKERGRRVIGWDEVLDSDFATDAIVMSWRGEDGGIEGSRRGHDVIMTPSRYLYFDFYQSTDLDNEPLAIGGYISTEDVYNYEPIPACLTDEEKKHILGVQANVWTEYIPTFNQVQYMTLPRMAALSEIQWTAPEQKDLKDFVDRLDRLFKIYESNEWRYADHIYNVHGSFEADTLAKTLELTLSTHDNAPIRYTTDGISPTMESAAYTSPLRINESTTILAAAERNGKLGRPYRADLRFSKATFCPVKISQSPAERYTFEGPGKLTDARLGTRGYADMIWLGFLTPEFTATIDLGTPTRISEIGLRSDIDTVAWIFEARNIRVEISTDGKIFQEVATREFPALEKETVSISEHSFEFEPTQARYVRVRVKQEDRIPQWHPGRNCPSYFFIDEITVN